MKQQSSCLTKQKKKGNHEGYTNKIEVENKSTALHKQLKVGLKKYENLYS